MLTTTEGPRIKSMESDRKSQDVSGSQWERRCLCSSREREGLGKKMTKKRIFAGRGRMDERRTR